MRADYKPLARSWKMPCRPLQITRQVAGNKMRQHLGVNGK